MKNIIKITFKSMSGYGPIEHAYNDKLTITPESIAYELVPYAATDENPMIKWKYKTNSPHFKQKVGAIITLLGQSLEAPGFPMITDVGTIRLTITYEDKSKFKREFPAIGGNFDELFREILTLVPASEETPRILERVK